MTDEDVRRERIKAKVSASQERLQRDSQTPAAGPLPDASPPEKFSSLVGEYPGLALAGGLVFGFLAGKLIPKGTTRKLVQSAVGAAAVAGELGSTYGKQALEKAGEAAHEGRERLGELGELGAKVGRGAIGRAGEAAQDSREWLDELGELGVKIGRRALDRASDALHEGRDKLEELGEALAQRGGKGGRSAARVAGDASSAARDAGSALIDKAARLASNLRH
ncbi:MAG: hypothetical protein JF593_09325 [Novosphingobium sp.]|nr:hypothetical protein [Novosphingobium sp.]